MITYPLTDELHRFSAVNAPGARRLGVLSGFRGENELTSKPHGIRTGQRSGTVISLKIEGMERSIYGGASLATDDSELDSAIAGKPEKKHMTGSSESRVVTGQ